MTPSSLRSCAGRSCSRVRHLASPPADLAGVLPSEVLQAAVRDPGHVDPPPAPPQGGAGQLAATHRDQDRHRVGEWEVGSHEGQPGHPGSGLCGWLSLLLNGFGLDLLRCGSHLRAKGAGRYASTVEQAWARLTSIWERA
jgi:hypothetical protein